MNSLSRRHFLFTGVGAAITLSGTSVFAQPQIAENVNQLGASASTATNTFIDDGLAHPIPYIPALGIGKDRALVLSGGGEYLLSWYMGYFHALNQSGVDMDLADIIVGTSAGSVVGAAISGGHLKRLTIELDFFGDFPKILNDLVPTLALSASQKRAIQLGLSVKAADLSSIQAVGRAAMAAHSIPGPNYATSLKRMLGEHDWPSPKMHTTANDCYTGERLIVSYQDGIPIQQACSASSSWPGRAGPTWLKDRYCMDGGVCQTSTHADVVMGAKRALIISLSDGGPNAAVQGLRLSSFPNTLHQEIKDLEVSGTKTLLITAGLPPGIKTDNLLDPYLIGPALKYGYDRGLADTDKLKQFWS